MSEPASSVSIGGNDGDETSSTCSGETGGGSDGFAGIAVSAGSTLQLPLVLRNDSSQSVELSLSLTVPEGLTQPEKSHRYQLSAGEVFPVQLELIAPSRKSEQINEVMCRATSATDKIGTVALRVRVGTGGLPQ